MNLLSRLRQSLASEPAADFDLGGLTIRRIRPVKPANAGIALNKAGRLVLTGDANGRQVKIFEAASADHAQFIARVSSLPDGVQFPAVLAQADRFLVCAWVEGSHLERQNISPEELEKLASLQARMHRIEVGTLPPAQFDYWRDIIEPRFRRAAELSGATHAAEEAIRLVEDWRRAAVATVNHPDLTLDNVIRTEDGKLVPIDNELLYSGPGAFMDVLNTVYSLPARHRQAYVDAYRRHAGGDGLPDAAVLDAFWLARQAGSLVVAGKLRALRGAFDNYGENGSRGGSAAALIR